ncbi:MAG: hypothetical protein AAF446_02200, partial [Pseudomonadota bacterium]
GDDREIDQCPIKVIDYEAENNETEYDKQQQATEQQHHSKAEILLISLYGSDAKRRNFFVQVAQINTPTLGPPAPSPQLGNAMMQHQSSPA